MLSARGIHRVLEVYCQASGQRVNFQKYGIYFIPKTSARLRYTIQETLGIAER